MSRKRGDDVVEVDVLEVADFRAAGDMAERTADEIALRAAWGYRTGLLHVDGPTTKVVTPFTSAIRRRLDRGAATLVLPHQRVRAKVVVVRQPDVVPGTEATADVVAEHVVVVGDRASAGSGMADALRRACQRHFGPEPEWTAAAPSPSELSTLVEHGRPVPSERPTPSIGRDQQTVLMVSSNGTGMGHLTRLLAYSRKAPPGVRPYFLSLSQAVPVVTEFGFPYEYVPSAIPTGMAPARWRTYLGRRLSEAIQRLRPSVVVFDGTWAYEAIEDVRGEHPNVPWVWSRRGMWYRGMNRDQLAKSAWFDVVLEPGDFSSPADPGVTVDEPATRVDPVTVLDRDELDDRAGARQALGIDPDAPTALVTLGAGNINDATSATRVVIDTLRMLGLDICVTVPAIAERAGTEDEHVHVVRAYPLSRYLHAFDVAVSAAGYNSFHELLRFSVPTLFLPNLHTSLDDQRTRATYAAAQGWAHSLDRPEPHAVRKLLEELLEDGPAMVVKVADADPGNGAVPAMEVVTELVRSH